MVTTQMGGLWHCFNHIKHHKDIVVWGSGEIAGLESDSGLAHSTYGLEMNHLIELENSEVSGHETLRHQLVMLILWEQWNELLYCMYNNYIIGVRFQEKHGGPWTPTWPMSGPVERRKSSQLLSLDESKELFKHR